MSKLIVKPTFILALTFLIALAGLISPNSVNAADSTGSAPPNVTMQALEAGGSIGRQLFSDRKKIYDGADTVGVGVNYYRIRWPYIVNFTGYNVCNFVQSGYTHQWCENKGWILAPIGLMNLQSGYTGKIESLRIYQWAK